MTIARPFALAAAAALALAACQATKPIPSNIANLAPAAVQPSAEALQPGLAVEYLGLIASHIDDVEQAGRGRPGAPIPHLNWSMGSGKVLTSDRNRNIAARIQGLIRFDKAGSYGMRAVSNDGIRVLIGGAKVIEDPEPHPNRASPTVQLAIATPGWYSLYVVYYQKRGSATLQLQWQPPGAGGMTPVPAAAFGHIKR